MIKDGGGKGETHHIQEDVEHVGFELKCGHVARQYGEVDSTCCQHERVRTRAAPREGKKRFQRTRLNDDDRHLREVGPHLCIACLALRPPNAVGNKS